MVAFIEELLAIILLTTAMDLLLPNGKMTGFVRMVMGLFIIITVLSPLLTLLEKDSWLRSWYMVEENEKVISVLARGEEIAKKQETDYIREYETGIARQITALVYTIEGVEFCETQVKSTAQEKLGAVRNIIQIQIQIQPMKDCDRIKRIIGMYYDVKESVIEVKEYEGGTIASKR